METLLTVLSLSGFGVFFLWMSYSAFQTWHTFRRLLAQAPADGHVDAALRSYRKQTFILASISAVFFLAAWAASRGFLDRVSQPPAPRQVPADLWSLSAPLYGSIVLVVSALMLWVVAASLIPTTNRTRDKGERSRSADRSAPTGSGFLVALIAGAASFALALRIGLPGLAAVRRLPAPQQAVFADCDPVIAGITALVGEIALAIFVWQAGAALLRPTATSALRSASKKEKSSRVSWSMLLLGIGFLLAGYAIFVGSCEYPEGSS